MIGAVEPVFSTATTGGHVPKMVLQQSLELIGLPMGSAVVMIGILALLLGAAARFRNPAAAVTWAISVIMLLLVALLDLGPELFWISVLGTTIVLIVGLIVRWTF